MGGRDCEGKHCRGGGDRWIFGTRWPASLADWERARPVRDAVSKTQGVLQGSVAMAEEEASRMQGPVFGKKQGDTDVTDGCMHDVAAAVVQCLRPTQDQASQSSSKEWGRHGESYP